MRKYFAILIAALLSITVLVFAQEDKARRLTGWEYENGNGWRTAVGDTVTGVAAAAASLDTVFIGILSDDGQYPKNVLVYVETVNVNNQDTLTVSCRAIVGGAATVTELQTDNLVGQDGHFVIKYDPSAGNDASVTGYALIFDGTKGADSDSTAYSVEAWGVYAER